MFLNRLNKPLSRFNLLKYSGGISKSHYYSNYWKKQIDVGCQNAENSSTNYFKVNDSLLNSCLSERRFYCSLGQKDGNVSEGAGEKGAYQRVKMKTNSDKPVIAIVGKPNVGKSTLFNRVVQGQRQALVEEIPGTTRDRYYGEGFLLGKEFILIDTGGLLGESRDNLSKDAFSTMIRDQANVAMEEADAILFVLDMKTGITQIDREIARMLRKRKLEKNVPIFVGLNKADNMFLRSETFENEWKDQLVRLGLGDPVPFSSKHGEGVMDLMESIVKTLPYTDMDPERDLELGPIRMAIVGQPNAGKSSLLNKIIEEERSMVSEIPGTTHDPVDCPFVWREQHNMLIVDTAGIRRRSTHKEGLEKSSVMWALKSIEKSHVVMMVIDATVGVTEQDLKIASFVLEMKKSVVVLVNKWDLYTKNMRTTDRVVDQFQFYNFQKRPKSQYFSDGNTSKSYTYTSLLEDILQENKEASKTNDHRALKDKRKVTSMLKEKETIKRLRQEDEDEAEDVQLNSSEIEYDRIVIHSKDQETEVDQEIEQIEKEFEEAGFDMDQFYSEYEQGLEPEEDPIVQEIDEESLQRKRISEYLSKFEQLKKSMEKEKQKRPPPPEVSMPKLTAEQKEYEKTLREKLSFLDFVPVLFTSAKTGYCVPTAVDLAIRIFFEREKKIKVQTLFDIIKQAMFKHKLPTRGKNSLKIKFASQTRGYPPTFVFWVNDPERVDPTYAKYLLRSIREVYPYTGTPIYIHFRKNKRSPKKNFDKFRNKK